MDASREFDIIIFGASSYVGQLVTQYLHAHSEQLSIAIAGRNHHKLAGLVNRLEEPTPPIIIADALDSADMDLLAQRARVIISTVGPYSHYGEEIVKACAHRGTGYVDLAGEVPFIRSMIDRYQKDAVKSGAVLVSACGFDSVPSDMGVYRLAQKAAEPLREVRMIVRKLSGSLSGGTIASMQAVSAAAHADRRIASLIHNPFALNPDPTAERDRARSIGLRQPDLVREQYQNRYLAPFFMAPFNTRVVRRSQALLGHRYGRDMRYTEALDCGHGLKGLIVRDLITGLLGAGFALLSRPRLRKSLSFVIPQPGQGAREKNLRKGGFIIEFIGTTESDRQISVTTSALGDPGYYVTAMMLSEAAKTLACQYRDEAPIRGGFFTPATALGDIYLDRLRRGGMSFN
ncbi:trans-acting enoyl reductase family protein [Corynebacterium sp. ES2715-CONJ3]|uniref:saccharopine dehydrogenase family protein n=1 Tax=Corynebacterium sp. ES2715-CONJ3 TaxID=2974028 RepID=UPI0021695302|nr:saccharopine dehydrogenase NADP-binding domain-containing protein [Corynebacterium sp. ES2715-CONJ3]MCS4491181.1 saccharopine dehydrogenase NADP-binding domain-containing protein [Corynebacterium sp. ES2715-CONJ3]